MKFKKLKILKTRVKIKDIFDIVIKLLEQKAKTKNIDLKLEIEEKLPKYIKTDGRRL